MKVKYFCVSNGVPRIAAWLIGVGSFSILGAGGGGGGAKRTSILVKGYYKNVHTCMHTHECTYENTCTCSSMFIHQCMHVHTYVCMHAHANTPKHLYIYILT